MCEICYGTLSTVFVCQVNVLADMECWGIGVDLERCIQARKLLARRLKYLEKEAYKLAGRTFSLHMPADIANVLFEHLKLPIPDGSKKGKQHLSTDKHCLDALRFHFIKFSYLFGVSFSLVHSNIQI